MSSIGPEQLDQILTHHVGPLVLYARQWCANPEDAVQDALLKLVREPTAPENVVGWLYRVVRNHAISAVRSEGRRRRREAIVSEQCEPWFLPSDGQELDSEAISEVLQKLPIEQRETIVARLWGGLSFREVAELTETSQSTAVRRYQAGLTAIRERLGVERET